MEDGLYLAHVAGAYISSVGNFLPNVNVVSFWQICQTLALPTGSLVLQGLLLENRFEFQGYANADEVIPTPARAAVDQHEL
jgi:hypothetical protein